MGLIFGTGAALMSLWLVLRLVPRTLGLTFWLGKTGLTAGTAALVLYYLLKGAP